MQFGDEFFGTAAQQSVSRRARDVWQLCKEDPRFSYNGRITAMVGDIGPRSGEVLASLARMQGATTGHFLPKARSAPIETALHEEGLSTNIWEFCQGRDGAYAAAQEILETQALPADLSVAAITAETDPARVAEFAGMAADCGVLAMSGRVMRGLDVPGVTLAAIDDTGAVVASAWGYKCYAAESEGKDFAFWGGLSCREDRRGERIALVLGAQSIVRLWEDLGVRGFCTGITPGNMPSFKVCEKLGVFPGDRIGMGVTDPATFGGGSLTK